MIFNCDECLIKICCSNPCEMVLQDSKEHLIECLSEWLCPDCGSRITLMAKVDHYMCIECKMQFHKHSRNKFVRYYKGWYVHDPNSFIRKLKDL